MSSSFNRGECPVCLLPSQVPTGHSDPWACIAALKTELKKQSISYSLRFVELQEKIKASIKGGDNGINRNTGDGAGSCV